MIRYTIQCRIARGANAVYYDSWLAPFGPIPENRIPNLIDEYSRKWGVLPSHITVDHGRA